MSKIKSMLDTTVLLRLFHGFPLRHLGRALKSCIILYYIYTIVKYCFLSTYFWAIRCFHARISVKLTN